MNFQLLILLTQHNKKKEELNRLKKNLFQEKSVEVSGKMNQLLKSDFWKKNSNIQPKKMKNKRN
jgi:hypothetical protein